MEKKLGEKKPSKDNVFLQTSPLWSLISVPLGIRVPHPKIMNYINSTAGIKSTANQISNAGTIAVLLDSINQ